MLILLFLLTIFPLLYCLRPHRTFIKHPLIYECLEHLTRIDQSSLSYVKKNLTLYINLYNESFTSAVVNRSLHLSKMDTVAHSAIQYLWTRVPFLRNDLVQTQQFKQHIHVLQGYLYRMSDTIKKEQGLYVRPSNMFLSEPAPINYNDDL
jgi:hypothetical protein